MTGQDFRNQTMEARWSQLEEIDPNPVPESHSAEHEMIDHPGDTTTSAQVNLASFITVSDTIGELDQLALMLREILAHVRERSMSGGGILVAMNLLINERFGGVDRWTANQVESAGNAELVAAIRRIRHEINAHVEWKRTQKLRSMRRATGRRSRFHQFSAYQGQSYHKDIFHVLLQAAASGPRKRSEASSQSHYSNARLPYVNLSSRPPQPIPISSPTPTMAGNRGYDVVIDVEAEGKSPPVVTMPCADPCRATSATPTYKKISNSTTRVRPTLALRPSID